MRVTADGERRRDTQVGVLVKAPAVTVLDARPGGLGADRLGWCNYVELIDTIFTDVEGVD